MEARDTSTCGSHIKVTDTPNGSTHYVNSRSHVRPKRYTTCAVPKINQAEENAESYKEHYNEPKAINAKKQKLGLENDSDSRTKPDIVHMPSDIEMVDHFDVINVQTETVTTDEVEDPQLADSLIDFLKHQENTVIEDMLHTLDRQNQWKKEDTENSDSEDEDISKGEMNADEPVQPGHSLSTKVAVLVIWMYAIMHSLTSEQLTDLLTMMNLFLMHKNPAFQSLYRFKNFFSNMKLPAEKKFFCSNCMTSVTDDQKVCANDKCNTRFNKTEGKEYFISLSIKSQLQNFFKRAEFREGLQHRFKRSKKFNKNIEDVYDSAQYKKLFEGNGPLSDPNNLSFILNTDGVPVFKSSKTSMWPVFLMINELPFGMRKQRENMILAGLWCGTTKPNMNVFFKPLQDSLIQLEKGFQVTIGEKSLTVKGYVLGMSCDLPARSTVLNINQHNGEFCCIKCFQCGKNHRTDAGGNIRVFPYQAEDPKGPERSHGDVLKHAEQAMNTNRNVYGVKGPSVAMFLPHFDVVHGVAIDYMHLVCLGITRLLLKLWFNVSHSLKGFSLYKYTDVVDSRLSGFKTPYFITRPPRVLSDMKFWKAAELRSWLLFYSIPCVMDLLQPNYLYHYCAFVEAIFLLSQSSIREDDLQRSEKLLNYFVFMMAHLYDERYLTINVHSLVHLPDTVRQLGPLWCSSCFAFEGANGELLKLFHGTQHIDMQIVNAVHVYQILPTICETVSNQSIAYTFLKSLSKSANVAGGKTCFLGRSYQKRLDKKILSLICEHIGGVIQDLQLYKRAVVRGVTFQSQDYTRVSKRNLYCVKYAKHGQFYYGFILFFCEHDSFQFACLNKATKKDLDIFNQNHDNICPDNHIQNNFMGIRMHFLNLVEASEELCMVDLRNILHYVFVLMLVIKPYFVKSLIIKKRIYRSALAINCL